MEPSPVPFERLYAHRDWVRRVARALVADESRASDLEQQVWLAAIEHPPREERSLRGWLGTVLRNAAGKMRRSEGRRTRREEIAPPPRAQAGPLEIVAETEAHERVVRAVLALEEPYRSTVLLRYFEDLGPADVAARLGVPLETVRTRLRRAIEQVRARLDGEHGNRRAWILLLLPLSRPSPRSAAVPVAAVIGGLLMGTAVKIAIAGAAVAAGLLLWTRPWEGGPTPEPPVADSMGAGVSEGQRTAGVAADMSVRPADAPTGNAAQAAVEVVDSRARPIAGAEVRIKDPAEATLHPGGTTDASGRVTVTAPRAGSWLVRASAPGFAPSARNHWIRTGTPEPVRIVLRQGFALSGSIRDAAGRPVTGAQVSADPSRFGAGGTKASSAPSGPDGRFRMEGLRAGLQGISIRTESGIVHEAGAIRVPGVSNLDVRIRGGVTVRGRVVDDGTGKPLSGVVVAVEIAQGGMPFSGMGTATTGEDGVFAIADLPPGDAGVRIRARREGYRTWPAMDSRAPAFQGLVSAGSEWEKEVRLVAGVDPYPSPERTAPPVTEPPGSIEGVVVDAAGAPAAGVSLSLWHESKPFGPPIEIVTESDGRFHRDGVPAGKGSLHARPSGRGVGGSLAFELPGGETLRGLRIEMKRGGEIAGRVLRSDGRPVEGPALWAARGAFSPGSEKHAEMLARDDSEVVIAPDGSFRLESLRAGTWCLAAGAEECSMAATILELAEGEAKAGVEILLDAGLEVAGRVVGGDGTPIPGALVRGWSESERSARGALLGVTGVDGAFRGTGFLAGPVHLQVEVDGCRTLDRDVSAGDRDIVLTPERATSLAGRVVEKGTGNPIAGVPVRARPERGTDGRRMPRGTWETVTERDGSFVIDRVVEGAWTVSAGAGTRGVFTDFLPETLKGVAAGATGIEIALRRGERIAGRFVDQEGSPYPGVLRIHVSRRLPDGGSESVGSETLSSDDGSFVIGGIEAGSYELSAGASVAMGDATPPNVLVKDARTGGELLVITVPRGARIRGRVENLPGPVGGGKGGWIHVRAMGEEDWPNKSCHLEKDGSFLSEPLDPTRTYDLLARDFPGRMGSLTGVRPGNEEVVVVLSAGLSLSGRVVDEAGASVGEGVPVQAWARTAGPHEPGTRSSATTRADGSFLLTGLGAFLFGVNAGGGGSEFSATYAGGGKDEAGIAPGTPDLVLHVRRGLILKGRLLDAAGKPVGGILVEPIANGDSQPGVYTGEDGSFAIKGLAPGTVKLRVDERVLGPFEVTASDLEVRLPAK